MGILLQSVEKLLLQKAESYHFIESITSSEVHGELRLDGVPAAAAGHPADVADARTASQEHSA